MNSELRLFAKWLGAGSNRRHMDFQSIALPTELPNQPTPMDNRGGFPFGEQKMVVEPGCECQSTRYFQAKSNGFQKSLNFINNVTGQLPRSVVRIDRLNFQSRHLRQQPRPPVYSTFFELTEFRR